MTQKANRLHVTRVRINDLKWQIDMRKNLFWRQNSRKKLYAKCLCQTDLDLHLHNLHMHNVTFYATKQWWTDSVQWSHLYSHYYSVQLLFFKFFLIFSPFFYVCPPFTFYPFTKCNGTFSVNGFGFRYFQIERLG